MANIYIVNPRDGSKKIIGDLPRYHILEKKGQRIGFFGLAEKEWIDTLKPDQVIEKLEFIDFIDCANEMIHFLKHEQ